MTSLKVIDQNKLIQTQENIFSINSFIKNDSYENMCNMFPNSNLFSHVIDDQFLYPCKRKMLYWESETPEFFYGKKNDWKQFLGSKNLKQYRNDLSDLPLTWRTFFEDLRTPCFENFLRDLTKYDSLKYYLVLSENVSESIEDSIKNYDLIEEYRNKTVKNNITNVLNASLSKDDILKNGVPSILQNKNVFDNKQRVPSMKAHTDSSDKLITLLFYFNNQWDDSWGGKTLFMGNSFSCSKNHTIFFKVSKNSWHSSEDCCTNMNRRVINLSVLRK